MTKQDVSQSPLIDTDQDASIAEVLPLPLPDVSPTANLSPQSSARRWVGDRGQATTEYALVLLGVATIALAVLAWAGGTDKIAELFDAAMDAVIARVV